MAFSTRGKGDRDAFIKHVDSLDVPAAWKRDEDQIVLAKPKVDPSE